MKTSPKRVVFSFGFDNIHIETIAYLFPGLGHALYSSMKQSHLAIIGIVLICVAAVIWSLGQTDLLSLDNEATDSPTLEHPTQIPTSDGKSYFLFGRSANEPTFGPKKLIIALPGHSTKAEEDFQAWLPHLLDQDYDLAVLNW